MYCKVPRIDIQLVYNTIILYIGTYIKKLNVGDGGVSYLIYKMSGEERRRPCNFLESFFVDHNVRFVIGWTIPHDDRLNRLLYVERIRSILLENIIRRIHITIVMNEANERQVFMEDQPSSRGAESKIDERCFREVQLEGGDGDGFLRNIVQRNRRDACDTTIQLTIYNTEHCVMNINHALMDAIAIKRILEAASSSSHQEPTFSFVDWGLAIKRTMRHLSEVSNDKEYLPMPRGHVPLKASNVLGNVTRSTKKENKDNEEKNMSKKQATMTLY